MAVGTVQVQPKKMDEIDIIGEDSEKRAAWLRLGKWISDTYYLEKYIIVGYAHGWLKPYELFDLLRREMDTSWVTYTAYLEGKSKAGDTINFEGNTYKYSTLEPEINIIKEIIATFTKQSSEEVNLDDDAELKELLSTFNYSEFEIFLNKYISNPQTTVLRKRKANNQNRSQIPESKPEPKIPTAAILVQKGVIDGNKNKTTREIHISERDQKESQDYVNKRHKEHDVIRHKRRNDIQREHRQKQLAEQGAEQPLQEPKKVDTKPEVHQTQIVPSDSKDKPKTKPGRLLQSTDNININSVREWLKLFRRWSSVNKGAENVYHVPTEQEIQNPDAYRWKVITTEEANLFKHDVLENSIATIDYLHGYSPDYFVYFYVTKLSANNHLMYDATK